ncbi:hypothetical protein N7507_003745 [Penicillium longicatenatum]|nr:hypothetical protein N7507_003745 [Penicillium longicatenatum]
MEVIIDTVFRERRSNGQTEQEATDNVIIRLSVLGQDIFPMGIDILRQRELIAENMNVYFVGYGLVLIGPADSGHGVTIMPFEHEMERLPSGSRWVDSDLDIDSNDRYLVSSDDETDQHGMSWTDVRDFGYGNRRRSNTEVMNSLPRQTVSDTVLEGGDTDCAICKNELEGDDMVIALPCAHWFCCECVIAWLGANDTCPMCRRRVF